MAVGTVIWTLPDGQTYVTTPGSALLFPNLCAPAGDVPAPHDLIPDDIAVERRQNREARESRRRTRDAYYAQLFPPAPPAGENDEPPPF